MNGELPPCPPPPPTTVTAAMTARTLPRPDSGDSGEVPVWLRATYDQTDPYAVTLLFLDHPDQRAAQGVEWVVARDVLWGACEMGVRSGDGDVVAEPGGDTEVDLLLSSPDSGGQPHPVRLPRGRLSIFLRQTNELVPLGRESDYSNMDAFIAECLGGVF